MPTKWEYNKVYLNTKIIARFTIRKKICKRLSKSAEKPYL